MRIETFTNNVWTLKIVLRTWKQYDKRLTLYNFAYLKPLGITFELRKLCLLETRIINVWKDCDSDAGSRCRQHFDEFSSSFEILTQHQRRSLANHRTPQPEQKSVTEIKRKKTSITINQPLRLQLCIVSLENRYYR